MMQREYKLAEVAENNGSGESPVWIILWGNVYDVSSYLHSHPGGSELISEYAGMDATKAFDDFGHSSDAKKMLKTYQIGVVAKQSPTHKTPSEARHSSSNAKGRRKLMRMILGPCVST